MFNNMAYYDRNLYIIGDVHGCGDVFEKMLTNITRMDASAKFIQVGDLIDRGPDLYDVFYLCGIFDVTTLIGNHEMKFYNEVLFGSECRSKARKKTHEQFRELSWSNQEFILDSIAASMGYITLDLGDGNTFTISHAPLKKVYEDIKGLSAVVTSSGQETDGLVWNNIYGHMAWDYKDVNSVIETRNDGDSLNIDSGCVYGKCLTAVRLNDMAVFQENNDTAYENMRKK